MTETPEAPRPPREPAVLWLAAAAATAAEAGIFVLVATGTLGLVWAGLVHAAVVLALLAGVIAYRRRGGTTRYGMVLVMTTAAMGPLGPLGCLVSLLAYTQFRRSAQSFEAWYFSLFDLAETSDVEALVERLSSGRAANQEGGDVDSFMDILRSGTLSQKQALLALLARNFRPAFANVLQEAVKDPTAAIRVQAASAMVAIEAGYTEKSIALAKATRERPDDATAWLALADHLDDYAYSGILDREGAEEARNGALDAYRRFLDLKPDHLRARVRVARILLRGRRLEETIAWIAACREAGVHSVQMDDWEIESLYGLGRWEEVRRAANRRLASAEAGEPLPEPVAEALALWREPPGGPEDQRHVA